MLKLPPKLVRAAGLMLLTGWICTTPVAAAEDSSATAVKVFQDKLQAEAGSQALCEAVSDRIFVRHKLGTACIAYIATKGFESQRKAVIYFEGDTPPDLYKRTQLGEPTHLTAIRTALQKLSERMKVRYVRVARLGLDGSSGNHANRRKPAEIHAMNAVVDALKTRLGFDEIILAGQSRGSLIAAALLTLGRDDVHCAALGSGVFEHARFIHDAIKSKRRPSLRQIARAVYDPSAHVPGIVNNARRRIFVLGDPDDAQVPFDQQQRFAQSVAAAGHHARLVEISATGEKQHGATRHILSVAGVCANSRSDEQIVTLVGKLNAKVEQQTASKASQSSSGGKRADLE